MRLIIALWMVLFVTCTAATTQNGYPSQPIRIIVPYPPGGVTDIVGRVAAEGARERLKTTVVVDNKPGANGIIGSKEFVRSKNDGYTLMIGGLGAQVIPSLVNPNYPFEMTDFVPLAMLAEFVNVMVVNKDLPVTGVQDFIAYARANPGKLNFATVGVGATNHLTAEMFMQHTGVKMTHIPYKGSPSTLQDLQGGRVDVIFENLPPSLGLIQSGSIKSLAVTSDYRVDQLPNVPTMIESGLQDFKVTSWIGIYGPKGLPDSIRERLSQTFVEIGKDPATRARFKQIGFEPTVRGSDEFAAFISAELAKWRKVVQTANIVVKE